MVGNCIFKGSSYIPAEYQPHLKCIVEQEVMMMMMMMMMVMSVTLSGSGEQWRGPRHLLLPVGDLHVLYPGCAVLPPVQDLGRPGGRTPRQLWHRRWDGITCTVSPVLASLSQARLPSWSVRTPSTTTAWCKSRLLRSLSSTLKLFSTTTPGTSPTSSPVSQGGVRNWS